MPMQALVYGPKSGPGAAAVRTARLSRVFQRAMDLFSPAQREMIHFVLLLNRTVNKWCATRRETGLTVCASTEMGRLLAILDVLATHFASEIEQDHQAGTPI